MSVKLALASPEHSEDVTGEGPLEAAHRLPCVLAFADLALDWTTIVNARLAECADAAPLPAEGVRISKRFV